MHVGCPAGRGPGSLPRSSWGTGMSDSESLETDGYFEGFEWPVPRAFASAVVQLRFEQGDVLYPDRSGYDRLEARVPEGLKALQILQPPRSARVAALEGEGDRRLSAWEGEVDDLPRQIGRAHV